MTRAMQHALRGGRLLEEVAYWREQAGWTDGSSSSDSSAQYDEVEPESTASSEPFHIPLFVKILAVALSIIIVIIIFRTTQRNADIAEQRKMANSRNLDSSSRRSRSKSASASRSRSRSRKGSKDYELMDDDGRSRKSSKSAVREAGAEEAEAEALQGSVPGRASPRRF
eukprot:CAMPEP_0116547220 /NCGR_PEP_ID=MMETSP0397-20121206/3658_1 /TAXON_ID=216820 /ORGANISM="Cyclophora tenuis, Strain ECT3854" /LENGTH=168 /DNA_ID=CAMNT_0004071731 /DNA_START=27 /DNA_END=534 /DNA_ORIENTATION=+